MHNQSFDRSGQQPAKDKTIGDNGGPGEQGHRRENGLPESLTLDAPKEGSQEAGLSGFAGLGIREAFCEKLKEWSITDPAPVQRNAIPVLLAERDAVIQSGTGTGKTLAYLLPLLEKVDADVKKVQGLIIVPTQELAMQIVRLAEGLIGAGKTAALIGGASLKRQIEKLKGHPPVAVGTPGRLAELIRLGKLKTGSVRFAVIDEADEVFSRGAGGEAEEVLAALPRNRRMAFVSATITPETEQLAGKWMTDAVRVGGQTQTEAFAGVSHEYAVVEPRDKIDMVRRFVRTVNPAKAILFVGDSGRIGEIEAKLKHAGLAVESLYSDAGKQERTNVMRRLSGGALQLVIATDLAARGLDLPDLSHIINFEPPRDAKTYLHRAGRTGRMGRSGTVVTLAAPFETAALRKLANRLDLAIREMVLSHGRWFPAGNAPMGRNPAKAKVGAAVSDRPAGRTAGKPAPEGRAKPAKADRGKAKEKPRTRVRERDAKNKGAPRWLKEKQKSDRT